MKASYSDRNNIFCIGETIGEMIVIPITGGAAITIVGPIQAIKWPVLVLSIVLFGVIDVVAN
jgi:hypothetical protein